MANTCCTSNLNPCDGLVTIGYMRQLASGTCKTVYDGREYSGCCDEDAVDYNGIDNSFYVPTYSEISGGTYAQMRNPDNENPNNDESGFIYEAPSADTSCCDINLSDKALMKNQLSFGYTEVSGNTLEVTKEPSECSPTFEVLETRGYYRHIVSCNNGEIVDVSTPLTKTFPHTTTFVKSRGNVTSSNTGVTIEINFDANTKELSGETIDDCYHSSTSTVSRSVNNYTIGYSHNITTTTIPCEGGTFEINLVNPCPEDDFSVTIKTSKDETVSETDTGYTITVPRNESGYSDGTVKVTVSVLGDEIGTYPYEYSRNLCEWSPSGTSETCSIFTYDWNWRKDNQELHECTNN